MDQQALTPVHGEQATASVLCQQLSDSMVTLFAHTVACSLLEWLLGWFFTCYWLPVCILTVEQTS